MIQSSGKKRESSLAAETYFVCHLMARLGLVCVAIIALNDVAVAQVIVNPWATGQKRSNEVIRTPTSIDQHGRPNGVATQLRTGVPTLAPAPAPATLPVKIPFHLAADDDDLLAPLNLDIPPRRTSPADAKQTDLSDMPVGEPIDTEGARRFMMDQEERILRSEQAKLEARARFEARNRTLIPPSPEPPSPKSDDATANSDLSLE
ncbi:MAG: hypothetical protein AAF745_08060, partial [Planctomycetota bacterium]